MEDLSHDITAMIELIGSFGKDPAGGVTRFLYSTEWRQAQQRLKQAMSEAGLETRFDAIGNLFGTLRGSSTASSDTILSGSHIDTVGNGGYYDGLYGVVGAFLAVKYLKERYGTPRRNLEVVSFAEEEGSRFPYAFWGSKNLVGTARTDQVENICDAEGIQFVDAMRESGFDFRDPSEPGRKDLKAFVEIHIEQGSVLETEHKTVGVVTSIVGQRRLSVKLTGQTNHAGTTPMGYRKDTAFAASHMIYEIISDAKASGDPLVATVGKIEVRPNMVNVVPGYAEFSVDIRHTDKILFDAFTNRITQKLHDLAAYHGVDITIERWMDEDPVQMSDQVIAAIETSCKNLGLDYKVMHSGAGHDSQILAPFVPTAMVFVPSRGGISHSPAEYTEPMYLAAGVKVLVETLYNMAYQE
ncbi:MAG: allantoate amidohydrolase [Sulfobacillus acidophilus]|uniref:Allantoate amidohydrolase n=1 Tax=Sulfobacillus acidophilus TaxID=53633 RepID=A0A2T2WH33_9FIRM|nr:MAG: allantoate amidohydrolase [Sulfobacillus acidophilus]